ncbi:hypothetical protein GRI62_07200 [Erythrobacter arachoides]|uniref:Nucleotidyltransferase family protein n=1 Tax=Aurantiacibacter arachoides TaxID=1850444 RepID=A0A845A1E8_9SPHN|nr:nucleotidyltransferase family protein [Aurantiacibacter arachoides]MXO93390.1 hypothetical protein [Aurantiacibacter arachoides]GGD49730.1 hypothetical protein GCM10011411_06920 [Aurantiacibacter arachoides]
MFVPSPDLQRLADALRPALDLPGAGEVSVQTAEFAEKRHRVAPLLHHAVAGGASVAGAEARDLLDTYARDNALRVLRQQASARRIAALLRDRDVPHAFVKGYDLGPELYGSTALRHSKDVDLLIDPARIDEVIAMLAGEGYTMGGGVPLDPRWAKKKLRFHWEVAIIDPRLGVQIELHTRLLDMPPPGWDDRLFLEGPLDLSNPAYVLYLIVHGAGSRWHRLKWLADLAMIARLTAADVRDQAIELADRYECLPALSASFRACEIVWGQPLAADWHDAIGSRADATHVHAHLDAFNKAIHNEDSNPQRESFARRFEIVKAVPVFGTRGPSRLAALTRRAGFWYTHRF